MKNLFRGLFIKLLILVSAFDESVAARAPIRIMALGDSLTAGGYNIDGQWNVGAGYRQNLHKLLSSINCNFTFVGSLSDGPPNFANAQHEGHSGWKIHEVSLITPASLGEHRPDIVILMVGSNDLIRNYEVSDAPKRLSALIDLILESNPATKLYVASVLTTNNVIYNSRVNLYNFEIQKVIYRKLSMSNRLKFVDMYNFSGIRGNTEDLTDGVHPTPGGYQKMARVWFDVLAPHCSVRR